MYHIQQWRIISPEPLFRPRLKLENKDCNRKYLLNVLKHDNSNGEKLVDFDFVGFINHTSFFIFLGSFLIRLLIFRLVGLDILMSIFQQVKEIFSFLQKTNIINLKDTVEYFITKPTETWCVHLVNLEAQRIVSK